jgi:glycosyltransferase involved in cell wall biosynthesis
MSENAGVRRICLLPPADLAPDSGSTLYTRLLANGLARAGCDVTLVCARSHPGIMVPAILAPVPLQHPFDNHQGTPNRKFVEALSLTLDALQNQWRPRQGDVVHVIYASYAAMAAGAIAALNGTTTVVSELGRMVNVASAERRYREMALRAFLAADHVIAATSDIADVIHAEFAVARERQTVIGQPQNLDPFVRAASNGHSETPHKPFVITTICSVLTEEKGVFDLLEAFCLVRAEAGSNLHLQIVGQDWKGGEPVKQALQRRIEECGLQSSVSLPGYRPHEEIVGVLAGTCVYVDARRVANFSSVIPEAMAVGVPIAASAVANNVEMLEDGIDALLFAPRCVRSLAEVLRRLYHDAALRQRLAARSVEWLSTHSARYSVAGHVEQVLRVYDLAGRPS